MIELSFTNLDAHDHHLALKDDLPLYYYISCKIRTSLENNGMWAALIK
jgi:hypothetical protein